MESDNNNATAHRSHLISDSAGFQASLASLPLVTYQKGETVLAAGSKSGRLLVLEKGAVEIVKGGLEIAKVTAPGAVLGELSVLLDKPHTADVRALETSQFRVADAAALLGKDPVATLYIGIALARRLDSANEALIELKRQLMAGQSPEAIGKTVDRIEALLGVEGASLVYAGYPYDPMASGSPR